MARILIHGKVVDTTKNKEYKEFVQRNVPAMIIFTVEPSQERVVS